jgi:hypothetical protein
VIAKYRDHLLSRPELMAALPELRGKTEERDSGIKRCYFNR